MTSEEKVIALTECIEALFSVNAGGGRGYMDAILIQRAKALLAKTREEADDAGGAGAA